MGSIFFFSDAHLGHNSPEQEKEKLDHLLGFLDHVQEHGEKLFILGDLFDFWFDYQWVIPKNALQILCALQRLTKSGVEIIYMMGNHDFWLGDFFTKDLNITVCRELDIRLGNKRFYISHGDGLNKKDVGYRILKSILRHPMTPWICRGLHPNLVFSLANSFSRKSREFRPNRDISEPYVEFAQTQFDKGFDCVLLAHTHQEMVHEQNGYLYLNTGEWIHTYSYAEFKNNQLQLKYWT